MLQYTNKYRVYIQKGIQKPTKAHPTLSKPVQYRSDITHLPHLGGCLCATPVSTVFTLLQPHVTVRSVYQSPLMNHMSEMFNHLKSPYLGLMVPISIEPPDILMNLGFSHYFKMKSSDLLMEVILLFIFL